MYYSILYYQVNLIELIEMHRLNRLASFASTITLNTNFYTSNNMVSITMKRSMALKVIKVPAMADSITGISLFIYSTYYIQCCIIHSFSYKNDSNESFSRGNPCSLAKKDWSIYCQRWTHCNHRNWQGN